MTSANKLIQASAGNAAGAGLAVEDVFSTYLYTGNGGTQTITNGVDLDGEGGMVWFKARNQTGNHAVFDTDRGGTKFLKTNGTDGDTTRSNLINSFNSDGFTLGNGDIYGITNYSSSYDFTSWTFRKAPKFFDVVTYTGNGTAGREIAHNIDGNVGTIIVKRTDGTRDWWIYHRESGSWKLGNLNSTSALVAGIANVFGDDSVAIPPSSSVFTVGSSGATNYNGWEYVAYLFAHNDGDGEFGEDADQDIIKCGSYTGNGSADGPEIDLGFEPQWVLVKNADRATDWYIVDNMRGLPVGSTDRVLFPNAANAEENIPQSGFAVTASGFKVEGSSTGYNASGEDMIYIAIRRGPMKTPESGTEVFGMDRYASGGGDGPVTGFVTDVQMLGQPAGDKGYFSPRLTGGSYMLTHSTDAEATQPNLIWDRMDGAWRSNVTGYMLWGWKRAPGFCDVVAYEGNGVAGRNVDHNLGVAPEFMIFKRRNNTGSWSAWHKDLTTPSQAYLFLNLTNAQSTATTIWNDTYPALESSFVVGSISNVNSSGDDYIAYLFATLPGVSKVGSYTGNGTSQTIDCGFSTGARFVMTKRVNTTGNWNVWDSERGIVAGNDPRLELNTTDNEDTGHDYIDPDSSGFVVNYVADDDDDANVSGDEYIFYAIA